MPELAIEVDGLKKNYGQLEAVKGIDLRVWRGEVFALLGPNGAGKTTTIEILEGYRKRTAGEVRVLGHDPARGKADFRRRIGIVLQSTGMEPFLTVEEVIEMHRGFYPAPRPLDEVIAVVGLTEKRKARVNKLSGGQQRRLDVAVGLAGDPELLFLDEPTTGFDPAARRGAWEMVRNLRALGKTIVLTTHYMDEAQNLADRVAIIAGGLIVAEGSPGELGGRGPAETTIRFAAARRPPKTVAKDLVEKNGVMEIRTMDPTRVLYMLTDWALRRSVELERLSVSRPSLEDVYLQLTGEENR